jgi:hypothetical protein
MLAVNECRDRLRRAGWSVGETGWTTTWLVTGSNGENRVHAEGQTQAEAWCRASKQRS